MNNTALSLCWMEAGQGMEQEQLEEAKVVPKLLKREQTNGLTVMFLPEHEAVV